MLQKICEHCETKFEVKDTKKGRSRRFCGPICSRRWAANNRSDSWRQKASLAKQGENNPMYGLNHSNDAKEKISQAGIGKIGYWTGKTHSEESNRKRSKALTGIKRSEETKIKISKANSYWREDDPQYEEFKKYRRKVYYWTNKNDLSCLNYYDKRALKGYHLDHKYSITEGFRNNVPPKVIGNINNLEFIHYKDNCSKGTKCSISLEELYYGLQ